MITVESQSSSQLRQLRDALGESVVVNWNDLMPDRAFGLIHVEYESGKEQSIGWLKIWSSRQWGHWDLICEYWMHEHPSGTIGLTFANGHRSAGFAEDLESIMQNQHMFELPNNGRSCGLIQIYPPDAPPGSNTLPRA